MRGTASIRWMASMSAAKSFAISNDSMDLMRANAPN
jgi:hypothetical protein